MATTFQIRKIHALKNVIGMDDDLYREMLMSFDVTSSKDLTYTEAAIFVDILEDKAVTINKWIKQPKKYADLNRTENMASDAQLRMIEGLWRDVCYFNDDKFAKKSLRKFLKSKFKVDNIMFLTRAKACKVIHPKECAMMGLIRNQKIDLEERLNDAKLKFADANLVKDNWSCAKEREIDCKVLEGQISILSKIERDLEDMLTPAKMPPD